LRNIDHQGRVSVADVERNRNLRQDPGFLAGVERVVDRLLDSGNKSLRGRVESEKVAVLEKELRDEVSRCQPAISKAVLPSLVHRTSAHAN
jgi:hypothetical protein